MVDISKICVVGMGYIGLPTAFLFAREEFQVVGVDIDQEKIELLKRGSLPFEEPGLPQLFRGAKDNIKFSLNLEPADVFIIAVPTPVTEKKEVNLTYLKEAASTVLRVIEENNLLVIESTVPPGTTKGVVRSLLPSEEILLAYAPERAIPGKTIEEITQNHRIIGGVDTESAEFAKELYSSFVEGEIKLTNATTAETVKILENTYRDINIAFANEIAKISEQIEIDVWDTIDLANLHPRVDIHQPGPGVGGHCIPIDPWFLVQENGDGNEMIKTARSINDKMPQHVVEKVEGMLEGMDDPTVTVLGVAYKANVGDWRETPALKIIEKAKSRGWSVKIHDPYVKDFPYPIVSDIRKAAKNSDCLVLISGHKEYKELDLNLLDAMGHKNIYDTRNIINSERWGREGFNVKRLGVASD